MRIRARWPSRSRRKILGRIDRCPTHRIEFFNVHLQNVRDDGLGNPDTVRKSSHMLYDPARELFISEGIRVDKLSALQYCHIQMRFSRLKELVIISSQSWCWLRLPSRQVRASGLFGSRFSPVERTGVRSFLTVSTRISLVVDNVAFVYSSIIWPASY